MKAKRSYIYTYLKKSRRPRSLVTFKTVLNPPASTVPWMMITIETPIIVKPWMTSERMAALSPPCCWWEEKLQASVSECYNIQNRKKKSGVLWYYHQRKHDRYRGDSTDTGPVRKTYYSFQSDARREYRHRDVQKTSDDVGKAGQASHQFRFKPGKRENVAINFCCDFSGNFHQEIPQFSWQYKGDTKHAAIFIKFHLIFSLIHRRNLIMK